MKRSKAQNPLWCWTAINRKDYGGDPASALLEVLIRTELQLYGSLHECAPMICQMYFLYVRANSSGYDLRTAANRMEVIQFPDIHYWSSFISQEDIRFLKAMKAMGTGAQPEGWADGAREKIIAEYTAESGVWIKEAGGCNLQECRGQTHSGEQKYYCQ